MDINEMLKIMVDRDAADLHLRVNKAPCIRLHGDFEPLEPKPLTPEDTERLMKEITPPRNQQQLQEQGSTDFAYAFSEQARFRTNVFRCFGNIGIVMRLIPTRIFTFEQLGLPKDSIYPILQSQRGMVIVTGPTGSGKTTSLATMIDWINANRSVHIITIEDPIEYTHVHKRAIVSHRELHVDTPSFANALRGALRQDPDVILVGEMRDLETMEAAITAAETGHLVFGTLHTIGAATTVDRIIDQFPANQQEQIRSVLAVALSSIISQTLLPKASGKGRVAAFEILHNNSAVANLIREKKTNRITSVIQTSAKQGMITLDDYLLMLYRKGVITGSVCLERAQNYDEMRKSMMGQGFAGENGGENGGQKATGNKAPAEEY
ncbi:MAG: type IV pilus twitching motility protein PilT [bacterium]|nr:type IV pilus twitching motility protein PilT [bacterium]